MPSEIEKYHLIHSYLKGTLSNMEEKALEEAMKGDASFLQEVELHKLANQAITEHYFLGVKDNVKKVIAQKAAKAQLWRKLGLGGAILVTGVTAYLLYPTSQNLVVNPNAKKEQVTPQEQHTIISVEPSIEPIAKLSRGRNKSAALPTKKHVIASPQDQGVASQVPVPQIAFSLEQPKKEEKLILSPPIPVVAYQKAETVQPEVREAKEKPDVKPLTETVDLILNPSRGEVANLPIDPGFEGELLIFQPSGEILFKTMIQNGLPNTWEGNIQTGGMANTGQYAFVLKSREGLEVKQGYISVVK